MAEPEVYVLRNARLAPLGVKRTDALNAPSDAEQQPIDVALAHGRIVAVQPGLEAPHGAGSIDLEGRWLLPGLVDHHVHFALWARQRARLDISAATSASEAANLISDALRGRTPSGTLVARGFQDALWPEPPTAEALDYATTVAGAPGVPVVVISHDLHTVWLNDAAAAKYGAPHAGVLREAAAFLIEQAVDAEDAPHTAGLIADAVTAASARGVTEIVDLQMEDNLAAWRHRIVCGMSALRVRAGMYPEHLPAALARGDRTGDVVPGTRGLLTVGPLKVFADGALNTRTALCSHAYADAAAATAGGYGFAAHDADGLRTLLARAHKAGLEVALHAIGDLAVTRALDAFEVTGARGSVEHAQLVDAADLPRFAALGIVASVQPQHALDDRDVTDAMWADRAANAFPFGALERAGARLVLGSDAPVADLDPWVAIAAAVGRTDDSRAPWQLDNALTVDSALAATYAFPAIEEGRHGDVVAVDMDPREASAEVLRTMPVALTMCAGRVTHSAL
jgi:predicted amidohydrolase YtcJ